MTPRGRPSSARPRRAKSSTRDGRVWHDIDRSRPHLLPTTLDDSAASLKLRAAQNPFAASTIGDFGVAVRIDGPEHFAEATLVYPIERGRLAGIDAPTVRFFRA